MHKHNRMKEKNVGLLGTIFGSLLISLPAIPVAANAAPAALNPCPRIYYEEPYDSTRLVPEGCPANNATRLLNEGAIPGQQRNAANLPGSNLTPNRIVPADAPTTPAQVVPTPGSPGVAVQGATPRMTNPPGTAQTLPVQPPLPENRSQAIATIMPMDGLVSVRLKNNTNALVTYEAVGHTQRQALAGGKEIVLRNLPVPVTITMVRKDDGFVKVVPLSSKQGMLEVSLDEEKTPLDSNQGVLRIQRDGQVFLN